MTDALSDRHMRQQSGRGRNFWPKDCPTPAVFRKKPPALGKPVLVMRDVTERPEAVSAGTARLVGGDAERIVRESALLLDDADAYAGAEENLWRSSHLYRYLRLRIYPDFTLPSELFIFRFVESANGRVAFGTTRRSALQQSAHVSGAGGTD